MSLLENGFWAYLVFVLGILGMILFWRIKVSGKKAHPTSGSISDKLLSDMKTAGISFVPEIMSFWQDLSPEVKQQIWDFWRSQDYIEHFVKALGAKEEEERVRAAEFLMTIKDKKLIMPLIHALGEPGQYVPARVAEVLISFGSEAVDTMIECLPELPEHTKAMVISILEEIGDRKAVPALIKELSHESAEIRMRAVSALGEIGDPGTADSLIFMMKDDHWGVKSRAAKALGKIGSPKAIPVLEEALKDEAWWVRSNAQEALKQVLNSDGDSFTPSEF